MMHMLYWTCLVYDYKRVCSSMPYTIAQRSRSMKRAKLLAHAQVTICYTMQSYYDYLPVSQSYSDSSPASLHEVAHPTSDSNPSVSHPPSPHRASYPPSLQPVSVLLQHTCWNKRPNCQTCVQAPAQYQRKPACRAAEQHTAAAPPQQHTAERTTLTLRTALGLYGLTHSELLWELQLDTRCLLGWNDSKIVLAFRGTASISNAWSDLQVMMLSAQLHMHGCSSVCAPLQCGRMPGREREQEHTGKTEDPEEGHCRACLLCSYACSHFPQGAVMPKCWPPEVAGRVGTIFFGVQAWRVPHPPVRGHRLCGTQPLVHKGFLKCWQAGGFNHKVIKRIMELIQSRKPGSDKLKIYVTGAVQTLSPCAT